MRIRDLFVSDVTRDIPPVVYFHEQDPAKLAGEVSEYIITGGWPEGHPNHGRVPNGIHEQYVRLLSHIAAELEKPGGPDLPNAWISGFYGSGKSSFAKLLGLALDGVSLPDGTSLADAWLRRNTSPRAAELRDAWRALRDRIEPVSVVFDVGGVARDNEHIHGAVLRQVQARLGYCTDPLVADAELRLERDGEWDRFASCAAGLLGRPWSEVCRLGTADDQFSQVMAALYPERFTDPMSWFMSRAGTHTRSESPEEAVSAIRDMLRHRRPSATLFLVIDEVSQYVLSHKDRVDRLRAFATALGATLRGRVWLLALGQQKLDEEADDSFLVWARDRFPPRLRVHLAPTNIRDVVHKRLLQKRPEVEAGLRDLFERHRPDLKLHAYACDTVTPDAFVEVYPMLPGQFDLILQITSALRTRSTRAQGDDQAIRGLLQLLGELFRSQRLADEPVGALVTLDRVYEVQHTALDSDVQASMARILSHCAAPEAALQLRAAKAVALLELVQDTLPTDARLVAQVLYDRLDRGNQLAAVTDALEALRRDNLLGYSEKLGYRIQSSAGEEWERERRDIGAPRDAIVGHITETLRKLMAAPERARLQGRPFPWSVIFSDGKRAVDVPLLDHRDEAHVRVDFRLLPREERTESAWIRRSGEPPLLDSAVWLCGDVDQVEHVARELERSAAMTRRYGSRRESLVPTRKMLLQQEENRLEDLGKSLQEAVSASWMSGKLYFRGRSVSPTEHGSSFSTAIHAFATRILPDLYPNFIATQLLPSELLQLVEADLSGPSPKLLGGDLGILELDGGRYVATCSGTVPVRVAQHIARADGLSGADLLLHFSGPPCGHTPPVVKACVAGLLRAGRIRIQSEGGAEITAIRDPGVRDLFDKDRSFRRANIVPVGEDDIGFQTRARIARFFEEVLKFPVERDDNALADAAVSLLGPLPAVIRSVQQQLSLLPGSPDGPPALARLGDAIEQIIRSGRQTRPTVKLLKKHLDALRDGILLLRRLEAELRPEDLKAVLAADSAVKREATQLKEVGVWPSNVEAAVARLEAHLARTDPWCDIASRDADVADVRRCYRTERARFLSAQETEAEAVRARVKARPGFSGLSADASHEVLRPIARAMTDTTAEAISPPLSALIGPFARALQEAEEDANERLDDKLSEGDKPLVRRFDLGLRNREVATETDVDALLAEIRGRLLEQVRAGTRVRLT
jgi:hypothetical protein